MSNTFETSLLRTIERSSLELLALSADIPEGEELDQTVEIEILIEVGYEPGYFTPGRTSGPPEDCYPDEGAYPEIISVIDLSTQEDIDLTEEEHGILVEEAEEDQAGELESMAEYAAEARYESYKEDLLYDDGY